jgi:hypothetical protein
MVSCWRYAGKRFRYWSYGSTATVGAPSRSTFQIPISPTSTGRLRSSGAARKCSSMARNPASSSRKPSGPRAIMVESPMAESME